MALIECSGCGAEISADAAACPKCGHPKAKQKALAMRPTGCAALFLGAVGVFMVVGLVRSCAKPGTDFVATAPEKAGPRPTPRNTPTEAERATKKKDAEKLAAANLKKEIEARRAYGPKLRQTFLDRRLDIKAKVEGKRAERLVLTFALFNDVWVNEFRKGDLIGEISGLGFEQVDFSDGYNYGTRITFK